MQDFQDQPWPVGFVRFSQLQRRPLSFWWHVVVSDVSPGHPLLLGPHCPHLPRACMGLQCVQRGHSARKTGLTDPVVRSSSEETAPRVWARIPALAPSSSSLCTCQPGKRTPVLRTSRGDVAEGRKERRRGLVTATPGATGVAGMTMWVASPAAGDEKPGSAPTPGI